MGHWKLTLSYSGTTFHGWQIQPGLDTVQGRLATALGRITGEAVLPQGSGRTDAGVHALAQVASFTVGAEIPPENLQRALNRLLPQSIRIDRAELVSQAFHARHSARRKTYEYRIFSRSAGRSGAEAAEPICSPFLAPFVWDCRWNLCLRSMQEAAEHVRGTHDFSAFAAAGRRSFRSEGNQASHSSEEQSGEPNPRKTIFSSEWSVAGEVLAYRVCGSGFLHHMVRNLVGTMVDIGRKSLKPVDMVRILGSRDRGQAGPTAPAAGLFLVLVDYGESGPEGAGRTPTAHEVPAAVNVAEVMQGGK